jgi:hypothetical protein
LPDATTLGLREIIRVIVFATCIRFMYERGEKSSTSTQPADLTMTDEMRALLNQLPDGVACQPAIDAEARAYTTGELEGSAPANSRQHNERSKSHSLGAQVAG